LATSNKSFVLRKKLKVALLLSAGASRRMEKRTLFIIRFREFRIARTVKFKRIGVFRKATKFQKKKKKKKSIRTNHKEIVTDIGDHRITKSL